MVEADGMPFAFSQSDRDVQWLQSIRPIAMRVPMWLSGSFEILSRFWTTEHRAINKLGLWLFIIQSHTTERAIAAVGHMTRN
jgi:hypothetical protein